MSCEKCNQKKGTQDIEKFLAQKPELLKRMKSQSKRPLKDATAVNSTRWDLFQTLKKTGLPITTTSEGRTKFKRRKLNLPKEHWIITGSLNENTAMIALGSSLGL